ncbi:LSU ribosomal protein L5P [Candidatus Kryptonium thompsonii]|jgi:large subunit ribosomal protein L5|uniref:Large ribosomal subunit protein uL5 n=1 Tax=Candidatus Kryptonium thompsonii TaxID=1633631 RepID=A0A0P1MER5_9BACT|nr:50S ribosomal protein L5 [Candidatus Kryptonium thompsoni]CUS76720.1 LSU ribosomal protein L5P [Candidatus Kryptonium thompsoni]CUS77774.1 LSU ribosomal protein L5P [Candidatus Kryptonium thompsoni]CUS81507.1 LSU ribosomal protein L5P [Candidatus Kryptonium thompsoni]CUS94001.1 LSU ribosomal protein L5P [Candidatus Kryptonium thompsoni]CUT01243.1 LSU ribosomal protein L5P [Candidatus Kryptonium thompsoni]
MAKEKKQKKQQEVQEVEEVQEKVVPRLKKLYQEVIVPEMMKKFNYKNVMQVPRLVKIVINMGVGQATQDPKLLEMAMKELAKITGQQPIIRRAKKSISNFKLRAGMAIGCKVTLRRERMYEFLDRLINAAIPRIRDFRGLSDKSFDGRGNYTLGIREHVIFPEINVDEVERIFGMDITIVTTAKTDEEAYELLRLFGMPFRKREVVVEEKAVA